MLILPLIIIAIENERDRDKVTEIYNKYYSTMMYAAMSILGDHALAEDAVSESIIKIINNLDKISDVSCYKTRGYVVIIVENTAKNLWRKRTNHREDADDALEDMPDGDISILDGITSDEGCEIIIKAIRSLPKTLSDVMYLSVVHGCTNTEVSKLLDISYDVTKMRLSRAKKAVRTILEGENRGK